MRRLTVMAVFVAVLTGSMALAVKTTDLPEAGPAKKAAAGVPEKRAIVWRKSLKDALTAGAAEYRPVFALFTSPDCAWCTRLKTAVFTDPEVADLLREYSLAEIDITLDPLNAERYQVRGVPAMMMLSADGDVRLRITGYVPASELKTTLRQGLSPEFLKQKSSNYISLMTMLDANEVPTNRWADIMIELGSDDRRKELQPRIMKLEPRPKKELVELLTDERLAVRLGALEMIEEISGKEWGFDPWLDSVPAESNTQTIAAMRLWAGAEEAATDQKRKIYSALSREQILAHIQDVISEDTERSLRAMRLLQQGGARVPEVLGGFLKEHADLPAAARLRIQEVRYTLALRGAGGIDAPTMARRLLHGNTDARVKALLEVQRAGVKALPVLTEFLGDRDPIVRETAVECLVGAGGWRVVAALKDHLTREKDKDVVYSILKNLGATKSNAGMSILITYLADENEDLVVAALHSLARFKTTGLQKDIGRCLADRRWRVRVAALEAASALKLSGLSKEVGDLLRDKDSFVRYAAVKTLTSISAKSARARLEEIYAGEEALMPAVVGGYCKMDIQIPRSFLEPLKGKSSETVLAVLEAMGDCGPKDLWLPANYLNDSNPDIACEAARLIARKGMEQPECREQMIQVLKKGRREQVLAVLEAMRLDSDEMVSELSGLRQADDKPPAAGKDEDPGDGSLLDGLVAAFAGGPAVKSEDTAPAAVPGAAPAPGEKVPADGVKGEDVFAAFLGEGTGGEGAPKDAAAGSSPAATGGSSLSGLVKEIETCMRGTTDTDIKFQAALLLGRLGISSGLAVLQAETPLRDTEARMKALYALGQIPATGNTLQLLKNMLRDPSEMVRTEAAELCMRRIDRPEFLDALLKELVATNGVLKPFEMPLPELERISENSQAKKVAGDWARNVLRNRADKPLALQNLALIILQSAWKSGDAGLVRELTAAEDQWLRRAAFRTLGKCELQSFTNEAGRVVADPSEYVRAVLPALYSRQGYWIDYLDKDHMSESRSREYYRYYDGGARVSQKKSMPAGIESAMLKLTADDSARVRVEAMFCMLSNRQPIDLLEFVRTIEAFPDQRAIDARVAEFLQSSYETLGPGFVVLVPFLERSGNYEYALEQIRKHFKIDPDKGVDQLPVILREDGEAQLAATYTDAATIRDGAAKAEKPKLVYFTTPGCQACEKISRMLAELRTLNPELEIETHNIRKLEAIRLNEVLSERLSVPAGSRLIAPAVFGGAGFLVKDEITRPALRDLLIRSMNVPRADWYDVSSAALQAADRKLTERSRSDMGLLVVGAGGLADGVNPCAFATIIFLISYLQVVRRTPRQILWVGAAFVAGVFITYFAMGLGLIELVMKAQGTLKWLRDVLNWVLAAVSLVIMLVSIRDGILCLRGRLEDITLQLPGTLKAGIHGVIRRGARQTHFVLAAFAVGVAISVLELACTGQMYLPMIGYMIEQGENRHQALLYLFFYNVMFVVPLLVIFTGAMYGLTSDALIRALRRHAAAVKFTTAALFMILFVYFVFGDRIAAVVKSRKGGTVEAVDGAAAGSAAGSDVSSGGGK